MRFRFLKILRCKIFGHKWIYSPQFCQRCHFDGKFYPVEQIRKRKYYINDEGEMEWEDPKNDIIKYKYI
jgi:hypothetical protein